MKRPRTCQHCGKLYKPRKGQEFGKVYCSTRCLLESNRVPTSLLSIYVRDSGICHLCGNFVQFKDASRDHILPKSLGGKRTSANLKLAHRMCNARRSNGTVENYQRRIGYL